MKAWFELKGNYPVVCSSKLGEPSYTVTDPIDSTSNLHIGAVCRRMLLTEKYYKKNHTDTKSYLKYLTDINDTESTEPVILCDEALNKLNLLLW